MIEFGKMEVEGFASIVKETFNWGQRGLNIIQAPNGHGKTTFINALVWVLYGKPLTGSVEPWAHVRPSSYCGTRVSQEITVNHVQFKIVRYKDYHKLKNSLLIETDDGGQDFDKKKAQEFIIEALGYSYDLFKNSVIFGQKLKRLIAETGPNKKKVFDDAFEVTYIGRAKKLADEKLKDLVREYNAYIVRKDILEEKVSGKISEIEAEESIVGNYEELKSQEIKEIIATIRSTKKEIKKEEQGRDIETLIVENKNDQEILEKDAYSTHEIIGLEKELTKLEYQRDSKFDKAEAVQVTINGLKGQLKTLPTKCDSCGKDYNVTEMKQAKKSIKEKLKKEEREYLEFIDSISIIKGQIKEHDSSISSATKVKEELDILNKDLSKLEDVKNKVISYRKDIKENRDKIKKVKKRELSNNIDKLKAELLGMENELKAQLKLVRRAEKDKKVYEWLIREPLSNSGLKAFIFNMMLDDINEKLEYYSSFIDFQVAFIMDMKSAHKNLDTYVFKSGEPVPYDDLSGGQQQAVDIVTAFSIHDVVAENKDCSLLVMDEVFESLDKDNIEIMTELIQDKAQHKCLYLVTHRAEFNPTNANIIQVDFDNGITSVS